jgi:hypothetical protein
VPEFAVSSSNQRSSSLATRSSSAFIRSSRCKRPSEKEKSLGPRSYSWAGGKFRSWSGRVYVNRTRLRSKKERLEAGKKGLSERAFSISCWKFLSFSFRSLLYRCSSCLTPFFSKFRSFNSFCFCFIKSKKSVRGRRWEIRHECCFQPIWDSLSLLDAVLFRLARCHLGFRGRLWFLWPSRHWIEPIGTAGSWNQFHRQLTLPLVKIHSFILFSRVDVRRSSYYASSKGSRNRRPWKHLLGSGKLLSPIASIRQQGRVLRSIWFTRYLILVVASEIFPSASQLRPRQAGYRLWGGEVKK